MIVMVLKLGDRNVGISQVYAPHQGRTHEEKRIFYEQLQNLLDRVDAEDWILMGDFNSHIGVNREGVETVIGAFGVGERNAEGERLLDFAVENRLSVMNTFYKHKEE